MQKHSLLVPKSNNNNNKAIKGGVKCIRITQEDDWGNQLMDNYYLSVISRTNAATTLKAANLR